MEIIFANCVRGHTAHKTQIKVVDNETKKNLASDNKQKNATQSRAEGPQQKVVLSFSDLSTTLQRQEEKMAKQTEISAKIQIIKSPFYLKYIINTRFYRLQQVVVPSYTQHIMTEIRKMPPTHPVCPHSLPL